MFPVLFQFDQIPFIGSYFGSIALYSHGVFLATGFLVSVYWFLKVAQKRHFHLEFIADHFFSLIVWSLIVSRIGFVFIFWNRYEENPLSVLFLWDGGYLLWAGILGFLGALYVQCLKQKEKIGAWLDVIVPAAVIAFIFENFGAFLAGESFGTPTELPWGIIYENPEVPFTIPVHPVQLYLLLLLLLLLIILQVLHKKMLRESFIGIIGLFLFAFFSFSTEYFRGDEMLIYFGHRFTQILQLIVMLFSLSLLFLQKRRNISS